MRFSKRAGLTISLLVFVAYLASAKAETPKSSSPRPKNTGCSLIPDTYYFNGECRQGTGGCYYCEHTDQYGTYGCNEAPDPNDGVRCFAIDYQNY